MESIIGAVIGAVITALVAWFAIRRDARRERRDVAKEQLVHQEAADVESAAQHHAAIEGFDLLTDQLQEEVRLGRAERLQQRQEIEGFRHRLFDTEGRLDICERDRAILGHRLRHVEERNGIEPTPYPSELRNGEDRREKDDGPPRGVERRTHDRRLEDRGPEERTPPP